MMHAKTSVGKVLQEKDSSLFETDVFVNVRLLLTPVSLEKTMCKELDGIVGVVWLLALEAFSASSSTACVQFLYRSLLVNLPSAEAWRLPEMITRQAMRKRVCITAEIICERGMASQLGRWEEQGVSVVKKERINGEELPGRGPRTFKNDIKSIRACGTATIRSGWCLGGSNRLVDPLEEVCQMIRRKPIVPQTLSIERCRIRLD